MIDSLAGKGNPLNIQGLNKLQNATKTQNSSNPILNTSSSDLADQISLSEESQQALETLRNLDQQLTRFLDVLKGKRSADSVIAEIKAEENGFIAGIESRTALNLTQIESIQETTSLSAEITNEGELDLILTQTKETLSQTNFSLSNDQRSFIGFIS